MEANQLVHVDVGDPVAVGQQEGVAGNVFFDAFDAAARHAAQSRFGQRDVPVFLGRRGVDLHFGLLAQIDGEIGLRQVIVQEETLDAPALVAQAEDEIGAAVAGQSPS